MRARGTPRRRQAVLWAQRVVLRTNRGPMRVLWASLYRLAALAACAYLRRGKPGASTYMRGSLVAGDPVYGPADIDLVVVVPETPGRPGVERARVHARWRALVNRLPPIESMVQVKVYELAELEMAAGTTILTDALPSDRTPPQRPTVPPAAAARRERLFADEVGLRIRPGLGSPTAGWRRLGGDERRPAGGSDGAERHLAAWLELQWWWRLCYRACLEPERVHVPYLCLKLITQSARVRLWLECGELISGHAQVISRSLATMPDEQEALSRAVRLRSELARSPDPPLAYAIGFLLRTSARVGDLLSEESGEGEGTAVRLVGADAKPDQLAITSKAAASLAQMQRRFELAPIVPLTDWRARTPDPLWRDSRVDPILADEALAPVATDPADPVAMASLLRLSCPGLRPALTWENVLVLPSPNYFDWVQRGVQFECSDPVSFALLAGESSAAFPALRGWSAADCAHRAVTAHARWLQRSPAIDPDEAGTALGLLLGAGRAAVFWQSLARDEPELPLTVAAVVDRLGSDSPAAAGLLDEALTAYRDWRDGGEIPDPKGVIALRDVIEELPAYRSAEPAGPERAERAIWSPG